MIETLGISLKEGRAFSRDFGADTSKLIFNEAAVKTMGMKDPIGKVVNLWGEDRQIIGVVKDFHFQSLHEHIKPLFFRLETETSPKVMAKIKAGREREAIERLQEFYTRFNPGYVLDYKFLNEDYQELYAAEQRVAVLSRYFAGLAILISCLGLFGLAAFTAERRLKEIGVRKVLGASELNIVYLLSSDFTKLVLASILAALPLSFPRQVLARQFRVPDRTGGVVLYKRGAGGAAHCLVHGGHAGDKSRADKPGPVPERCVEDSYMARNMFAGDYLFLRLWPGHVLNFYDVQL